MDEFAAATEELTSLAADSAKHGEPIKDYEKLTPIMNEIGGYIRSAKRWIGAPK